MSDSAAKKIDKVYELIQADNYVAAESLIAELKLSGVRTPDLKVFEAVCEYEARRDINCLLLLAEFSAEYVDHPKIHYAVFTAATCLENLGLTDQALNLLEMLPENYPDLEREKAALTERASQRDEAIQSAVKISQSYKARM